MTDDTEQHRSPPATRAAYDELFARHLPALVAFLRHKVGGELAARESVHDLAQSVCREVIADLDRFELRADEQFRAYLFLQATRKVIDRYRYHRKGKRDMARTGELPDDSRTADELGIYSPLATPTRAADARDELARVERMLQYLPEAQRDAIFLSRIAGLGYADIAASQGVSESA
ncbi:MAG: sigma-70 family RNA polymerase sigma factor, partial [Planctomycetes bacterium]|nr:sigma-70 family RNA polymerase sigma factor [Planctomycetota bacterium]